MPPCKFVDENGINCSIKNACFGVIGTKKGIFCSKHKLEDYVDLKHKKCVHHQCRVRPSYAFMGERPRFCEKHKELDMIDVVSKQCENPYIV